MKIPYHSVIVLSIDIQLNVTVGPASTGSLCANHAGLAFWSLERAELRHYAEGIFSQEALFGVTLRNSDGRDVPVRLIGEQHVQEELSHMSSFADWARLNEPRSWMMKGQRLGQLQRGLETEAPAP
jgi:hypothetical protein